MAAFFAGEMRMALRFGAVMGELKVRGSFIGKDFVDETSGAESFEGAVYRNLVEAASAEPGGDFILCKRFRG